MPTTTGRGAVEVVGDRGGEKPMTPMDGICARSLTAARALRAGARCKVAFVTCSYDTAFEPVADQVEEKIRQLSAAFGVDDAVEWSLWIVDDLPPEADFGAAVRDGFARAPAALRDQARLRCVPMSSRPPRPGGLKGRALLDGMVAALSWAPDLVVYLNLNLKVDARFSAVGVASVVKGRLDVAIGSRAEVDGGVVAGAGTFGRIKSRVYSRVARTALPPLGDYVDTNAPVKVFSAQAARHLVTYARLDEVTLDCEWLLLCQTAGFRMGRFPIAWIQRAGSPTPWHFIASSLRDVWRVRRRWAGGELPRRPD